MTLKVSWCDEFVRANPLDGSVIDGDGQAMSGSRVRLASGRNEFASFQLLAGPVEKGDQVFVVPSDLKGSGGEVLSAGQFDVFVAWYLPFKETWYPEALLPQEMVGGSTEEFRAKNAVKGQQFAGFWVDVFVPVGTAPGAYSGGVTVKCGSKSVKLPVSLTVHAASIPDECCMDVSLNNYADAISMGWKDFAKDPNHMLTKKYLAAERGVWKAAHEHRMFFHYIPYTHGGYVFPGYVPETVGEGPKKKIKSWKAWDEHFGPYFDGSAFKGTRRGPVPVKRFYMPFNLAWPADFVKFGQPGYEAEWRAVGKQIVDHFKAKGWTKTKFDFFLNHKQRFRFFPWDGEETRFVEDNDLHRYFRKLWEGTYDRKSTLPVTFDYTLGTTWTYGIDIKSDFKEFIDVYIAGTFGPMWWPEETPKLHELGRQIWSCTHSGEMTCSTRAAAFTPVQMWMRDNDGFMPVWWSLGQWSGNPWRGIWTGGDNYFYPGSEFNCTDTFPSLRLKVMRNALQMMDKFQLAAGKSAGGKDSVKAEINATLGCGDGDWFNKRPEFADKKLPMHWEAADWATEEPTAVGWQKASTERYRKLRALSLKLASK
ncbi:MAG: hypothetical protein C0404_11280 [Verrucomicrobia bacterium]|nr:hypothetical protein [Verrucomicrobiota bacterium]